MRLRATLVTAALLLTVTAAVSASPAAGDEPPEQLRAFWVDAFNEGIYSPEQVEELVDAAVDANHNAIIAQVVRRADCFCNDALPPRTDALIDPEPYDPLAELIDAAHAEGIEVHAWMNMNTMWNLPQPHSSPEHPINAHGPDSDDPWVSVREDGVDTPDGNNYFFDPGHPDAMAYIVDTAVSIVERYDVDGINLDYIRYPDFNLEIGTSSWGYNDVAVGRFQEATGRDDVPEASDEQWAQWRRDQVTNTVRRIYLEVFDADPSVAISVNTVTYGHGPSEVGGWEATRTYAETLQDFRGWMEEGIVDLNVPMNYKREWADHPDDPLGDQHAMFREWNAFIADHQYDRHAVVGTAAYLNEVDDTLAQVRTALEPSEAGNEVIGWTGYSYATPSLSVLEGRETADDERDALRQVLTEDPGDDAPAPFAEPAAVPEMTWRTEPTHGHVRGQARTRGGERLDTVTVHAEQDDEVVASTLTDGQGWFGFVDLEPGRYKVTVDVGDARGVQPAQVDVAAGALDDAEIIHHGR